MIRLALVDDHTIMREALREILQREPDIDVVGEAGCGTAALALAQEVSPDLMVMDIALPDISGIETTRRIVASHRHIEVLALSTHIDRRFVVQMMAAGAKGYINKAAGRHELLQGIRTVASGRSYICQDIAHMLANSPRTEHEGGEETTLGKRELDVLALIAEGRTSPEIATRLHIATGTVEVHRRNIMRKLDMHNIAELTKYALRCGLISS